MSKSPTKKAERLEDIVIGAGFLLQTLLNRYHNDLSEGMSIQVRDCLRDCNQVAKNKAARQAKETA
jgi:hypothetical protein